VTGCFFVLFVLCIVQIWLLYIVNDKNDILYVFMDIQVDSKGIISISTTEFPQRSIVMIHALV
jgi:hypothetical protein